MTIQRRVIVSGRVQGVSFRASTVQQAKRVEERHGAIRGFVRNLPDGTVEAVFQGGEKAVTSMIEWCRRGPLFAEVTDVEISEESVDPQLTAFGIR